MFNDEKVTFSDIEFIGGEIYNLTGKLINPDIIKSILMSTYTKLYQNPATAVTVESLRERTVQEFLYLLDNVGQTKIKSNQLNSYEPNLVPFDKSIIKLTNLKRSEMSFFSTYNLR
jgi:hypothetical protein